MRSRSGAGRRASRRLTSEAAGRDGRGRGRGGSAEAEAAHASAARSRPKSADEPRRCQLAVENAVADCGRGLEADKPKRRTRRKVSCEGRERRSSEADVDRRGGDDRRGGGTRREAEAPNVVRSRSKPAADVHGRSKTEAGAEEALADKTRNRTERRPTRTRLPTRRGRLQPKPSRSRRSRSRKSPGPQEAEPETEGEDGTVAEADVAVRGRRDGGGARSSPGEAPALQDSGGGEAAPDHARPGRERRAGQQGCRAHDLPLARRPLLRADAEHGARRGHLAQDHKRGRPQEAEGDRSLARSLRGHGRHPAHGRRRAHALGDHPGFRVPPAVVGKRAHADAEVDRAMPRLRGRQPHQTLHP